MPDPVTNTVDTALKSLARDGELSIRINGNCMQPLIYDGALITVQKRWIYWPGDILVKRCAQGRLIAHRLIGYYPHRGGLNIVTRADNAGSADAAIDSSQIIGRVAGGECAKSAVSVPVGYRIKAMGHFTLLVVKHLGRRIRPLG